MNTSHYVNALFIMERSKDAKSMMDCIDYVVDELTIYSSEESEQILVHLIPMMLEFFKQVFPTDTFTSHSSASMLPPTHP
jgi:uncharacterized protein YmfQ (DUF2313 family)